MYSLTTFASIILNAALIIMNPNIIQSAEGISGLSLLLTLILLTLTIVHIVYHVRVISGLIEVYGEKRRWIWLWLMVYTFWLPALLWGFSPKYQPAWKVEDIQAEYKRLATHGSVTVMDQGLSVNLRDRTVTEFFQKKILLRDIDMNIPLGHMVLLLGGSGAGKTTFLNAINGYEPAHAEVVLNGSNMYKQYKKMQYEVGFVPQSETMCGKDTVYNTLMDAAKLRLSRDVRAVDRKQRVEEVMEIFGLTPVKGNLVEKLSGGLLNLPSWSKPLTVLTISNPAVKVLCTQSNYNDYPINTIWTTLTGSKDQEIGREFTVGQILDFLENDSETMKELRSKTLGGVFTLGQLADMVEKSESYQQFREEHVLEDLTVRDVMTVIATSEDLQALRDVDFGLPAVSLGKLVNDLLAEEKLQSVLDKQISRTTTVGELLDLVKLDSVIDKNRDLEIDATITLGQIIDAVTSNGDIQDQRDQTFEIKTTVGSIIDLVGEDNVKKGIESMTKSSGQSNDYSYEADKVWDYWTNISIFILAFAALSIITLEFIDKDRR